MEPISIAKISLARIYSETISALGIAVFAFVVTSQEIAIAVTILLALVGGIVWLVRLEGRINTQTVLLVGLTERMNRISDKLDLTD